MSTSYQPPSYAPPAKASDPLLGQSGNNNHQPGNRWDEEGESDPNDVEDFKYGVTVSQSSKDVRDAFVRKVYTILFIQLLASAIVGWVMTLGSVKSYVATNIWIVFTSMIGSIGSMLLVYWKRHSFPLNLALLGLFTGFESIAVGFVASQYSTTIVLQALVITSFVFIGLTLFTFQSKYDFSSMGSYLFAGLLVFFLTGIVGIFLPYSRTMDMIIAGAGCLLFSAYIVYDTHQLLNRLSADEWVLACVSLYLDVINLFLQILRLLSSSEER